MHVTRSVCHPGIGLCICPSGYVFVPGFGGCCKCKTYIQLAVANQTAIHMLAKISYFGSKLSVGDCGCHLISRVQSVLDR
ncbi:uncharacterized protein DEA37_0005206 [Paragonimus westermani]|uniref:Uncharacterized protein n=1 Tax=Paragonimus westermani TaxID=34504 RepID=A0A5J4N6E6_9TREM|nr:uncharacterized protein DEA37_0005206 [Paragonimus westermani]